MKKVLISIVATFAIFTFVACNGDYNTSPGSAASNSQNPLNLLDSAGFNWTGTDPFSADIDGVHYQGDSSNTVFSFPSGVNTITSTVGIQGFILSLSGVYAGSIYYMGLNSYNQFGIWRDTVTSASAQFYSYRGNVGQVQILRSDASRIIGKFYFQGVSVDGKIINVKNGWFNLAKP